MTYPTPKQRALIEAIEDARRFDVDGGGWVHFTEEPMFEGYSKFCKERGLDTDTYPAVRAYLDKYKLRFLEYQSTCRHNERTMDRVSRADENEAWRDMGLDPPNDFVMDDLVPEG